MDPATQKHQENIGKKDGRLGQHSIYLQLFLSAYVTLSLIKIFSKGK